MSLSESYSLFTQHFLFVDEKAFREDTVLFLVAPPHYFMVCIFMQGPLLTGDTDVKAGTHDPPSNATYLAANGTRHQIQALALTLLCLRGHSLFTLRLHSKAVFSQFNPAI